MPDFIALDALVGQTAATAPDRIAVIDGERELSYAGLNELIDRVAAAMQADGLAPRDVISICSLSSNRICRDLSRRIARRRRGRALAPSSTPHGFCGDGEGFRRQDTVHGRGHRGGDGSFV